MYRTSQHFSKMIKTYIKQAGFALLLGIFFLIPSSAQAKINAPTNVKAVAGNGVVYITFTPSTTTAGEKVAKYYAYTNGTDNDLHNFYYEGWSVKSPIVVKVPNNQDYRFRVYAVGEAYNFSNDSLKTEIVRPTETATGISSDTVVVPTGGGGGTTVVSEGGTDGKGYSSSSGKFVFTVQPTSTSTVHVEGNAPGFSPNTIFGFTYGYDGGTQSRKTFKSDSSKNFSFDVTGLIPSRYYGFAFGNETGTESYGSGSFEMEFQGLYPGTPTNVTPTADDASVVLTFTPPTPASSSAGSIIKYYSVRITPDGHTFASGPSSPLKVVGLENGKSYQFEIRAVDSDGFMGAYSIITKPVKPNGPTTLYPDAVLNVKAVAGDKEALVYFTPLTPKTPSAGSKINFYSIFSTPDIGSFPNNTTSPVRVTGLTNGKTYTFKVKAQDMDGFWGTESNSSNPVTPVGVPEAPTNIRLVPQDGGVSVYWQAPKDTGGFPILSYTVGVILDGKEFWNHTTSKGTSLYVSSLENGKSYKFTVFATNKLGDGPKLESGEVVPSASGKDKVDNDNEGEEFEQNKPSDISKYFQIKNPLKSNSMEEFIARVLEALVLLLTPILVLAVILSGFLFVKARGNPEELGTAKRVLMYTLVGSAIVLGAEVIANALSGTLSNF